MPAPVRVSLTNLSCALSLLSMTHRTFSVFNFGSKTGAFIATTVTSGTLTKTSGTVLAYGNQVYDAAILVLTCKAHHKVLLREHKKSNCYYMPFFPLKLSASWKDQICHYLNLLLKAIGLRPQVAEQLAKSRHHLHQLNQLKQARYAEYLYQLVVLVELDNCHAMCDLNDPKHQYKVFPINQMAANHQQIWGPEPWIYLSRPLHAPNTQVASRCRELTMDLKFKGCLLAKRWAMAQSISYSDHDLIGLYNDFLQHCYPSQFMNQVMFENYLAKTELKLDVNSVVPDKKLSLYAAFCIDLPYVRFKDLVLGMVALDPNCNHGDIGGELRSRCIFRYYSKLGSTFINFNELVAMNRDIAVCKKGALNPVETAEAVFSNQGLDKNKDGLSMEKFIQAVGKLEIRGLASSFRAVHSPLKQIRGRKAYQCLWAREVNIDEVLDKKPLPQKRHFYCRQCGDPEFTLAQHSISYNVVNGEIVPFQEQLAEHLANIPISVREQSQDATNSTNKFIYLREILRRFSFERQGCPKMPSQKSNTSPFAVSPLSWMKKADRIALVDRILQVCTDSKEVFLNGPRVVRTSSPVFVFGDIHGNFFDLMIFDHLFWRMAPIGFVPNTLFLGDYVDRGNDSVECAIYLLCMKLLLPERFHLLRGNHEMRSVQTAFTTYRECLEKFGSSGEKVWESLNSAFDCLPLCAVVDEQIFAAHGGIPASSPRLEALYTIDVPLKNPSKGANNKTAWEVLWNDPITDADYKDFMEALEKRNPTLFSKNPPGFVFNTRRGTAYFYNYEAVDRFLELNGLNYLLRAHELVQNGFKFLMDGRMISVFSSSHYCRASNESAVVFIEHSKIRVIKLETDQVFSSQQK